MRACDFKECESGLPGKVSINENMDDGCWRITICRSCAEYFKFKEGDDIHDGAKINAELKWLYKR